MDFIYKYRNGFILISPLTMTDKLLREIGASKPIRGRPEWKYTTRYADLVLLEKLGYTGSIAEGDTKTEAWVEEQKRYLKLSTYLQTAIKINKEAPVPSWSALFPHQRVGASYLVSRKRALLSLTPGLGKTNTAITGAEILKAKKILVVAPLTLLGTWQNEILQWSSSGIEEIARIKGAFREVPGARWYVTNIDSIANKLDSWLEQDWDVVIGDESILYKNWKTRRTKAMKAISPKAKYMWLLSGNPVAKFSDDLFAQMSILFPDDFTSYWRFANRWCLIEETPWGSKVAGNRDPKGLRRYLDDVLITRTPDEAFHPSLELDIKFPDLMLEPVYVELNKQQHDMVKALENEAQIMRDNGEVITITAAIAMLTRVQQIVSSPVNVGVNADSIKAKTALDLLDTAELPAIVWFQFREGLEEFVRMAVDKGHRVGKIHGGVRDDRRQEAVDAFQNGDLDIICIQLDTGKYGLSITRAKTVIYHDRNMSLDAWLQSTHRVRRLSSKWQATGYVIHGGYTDFLIDKIIREKIGSLSQLKMTDIMEATFKTTSRALPIGKNKTHSPAQTKSTAV